MSDRIESIDPKLRALLDSEAAESFATEGMRSRILAGVTAAVGGSGSSDPDPDPDPDGGAPPSDPAPSVPNPGVGGGAAAASVLAKPLGSAIGIGAMTAMFAAGVTVGTQVTTSVPPPAPAPIVQPAAPIETPPIEVAPIEDPKPSEEPRAVEETPPPAAKAAPDVLSSRRIHPVPGITRAKAQSKPVAAPKLTALAEEERVIERARNALARGYHDDALAALDDHVRRFPAGALSPDRDGLRALVLSRAGRKEEAARAAAKYLTDHPQGTLAPAVEEILEEQK